MEYQCMLGSYDKFLSGYSEYKDKLTEEQKTTLLMKWVFYNFAHSNESSQDEQLLDMLCMVLLKLDYLIAEAREIKRARF